MNTEQFNDLVEEQVQQCTSVLVQKGVEYATEDRLHNFKIAAEIQGTSVRQALAGMMAKHTVSIYDMMQTDELYSIEVWEEKITDHINYLLLLKAIVTEETESELVDFSQNIKKIFSLWNKTIEDLKTSLQNLTSQE